MEPNRGLYPVFGQRSDIADPMEVVPSDTSEALPKMTYREAAMEVLKDRGPLPYRELADAIVQSGIVNTEGTTPERSLNSAIAVDIKRKGDSSAFVRTARGVFGLRGLHEPTTQPPSATTKRSAEEEDMANDDTNLRVRVPYYPVHSELRELLRVWPGRRRKQVTGLRAKIVELGGTRKQAVDWTDPGTWIPDRLVGDDRELAQAIWDESMGTVNPRHIYGHWLLAQRYALLSEDGDGFLQLTEAGRDFLEQVNGETESAVDEAEGLIKLLSIVADKGPARAAALTKEWGDYLLRRSLFGTDSTIKDTMRRRLANLIERELVERNGNLYSATSEGLAYLQKIGEEDSIDGGSLNQVWALVRQQESTVRESLRELLHNMEPFALEHLIKRLLEEMDYRNVEVTARSSDGGVDVVGEIELGITWVREVVQVKRHRRSIQRKDLDALRGSLYRFKAVRGTIVTTSRFAQGTKDAALDGSAAPITLVDGDRLLDLLIEHGIGVRKRPFELLEVNLNAVAALGQGN